MAHGLADADDWLKVAATGTEVRLRPVRALLWLSGVFGTLRRAEGRTPGLAVAALVGGTLAAASTVMGALIEGTLATRIDDLGPERIGMWWTMFLMSTGATLLGLLLLIAVTAVITLQTHLFGPWFAAFRSESTVDTRSRERGRWALVARRIRANHGKAGRSSHRLAGGSHDAMSFTTVGRDGHLVDRGAGGLRF
ncbi:MAG: hypothetical protein ACXVLM_21790 [Ilumatobacteraceae bacterium]